MAAVLPQTLAPNSSSSAPPTDPSSAPQDSNPNPNPTVPALPPPPPPPPVPSFAPSFRPLSAPPPMVPHYSTLVQNPMPMTQPVGGPPIGYAQVPTPYAAVPNGGYMPQTPVGFAPPPGVPRYPSPYPMFRPGFPPRPIPGMMPQMPRPPIPGIRGMPPVVTPLARPVVPIVAPEKPQTTVWVGKIAPTVDNEFILSVLKLCGPVKSWKRPQGPSDGTLKSFGFCEFESAEGVLRALRLLSKLGIDGQELMLNINEATKKYLKQYVQKKTEREKLKEAESTEAMKDNENAEVAVKVDPLATSAEDAKSSEDSENKEKEEINDKFGLVTDEDHEADRDALEKIRGLIEERSKNKPVAPSPSLQAPVDASAKSNSEVPSKPREGDSDINIMKNEDKNDDETSANKPTSENDKTEVSSPDKARRQENRSRDRDRDRDRDLKLEKERELERVERERERERNRREREREYKIREAERLYKDRLKDWEARERDKEHQRQYEKEREKDRERERRKEIMRQEEDNDYDDSRKRKRRNSNTLEEKRRRRQREKEEDLNDVLKEEEEREREKEREREREKERERESERERERERERVREEEMAEANRRDIDEQQMKDVTRSPKVTTAVNQNSIVMEEGYFVEMGHAVSDLTYNTSADNNYAGDVLTRPDSGDDLTMSDVASSNLKQSSSAPARKLGFGLIGSGKKTTVPSVFHAEDDENVDDKKMRPLVPIDYSTEELEAVQTNASGAQPNLVAAAEFAKRISGVNPKEEKTDLEKERSRRSADKSNLRGRDRNDGESTRSKDDIRDKMNGKSSDRDKDREDKPKAESKKLLDAKQLIDMIPKTKEKLFVYEINWEIYDAHRLEERMKPWISKKINEFLGEEEPTLVDYIMKCIKEHVQASKMLELLQSILDDEVEMFVLKMWRMLIFEIKKVEAGLSAKLKL